jgi:hypothetical protein
VRESGLNRIDKMTSNRKSSRGVIRQHVWPFKGGMMGKTCAWCGTLLRATSGTAIPMSHALCHGCLDELQSALSSNGLKEVTSPSSMPLR